MRPQESKPVKAKQSSAVWEPVGWIDTNLMTWLHCAHMGVRFPAGICSALWTNVSCSVSWGGVANFWLGAVVPDGLILFDVHPLAGAGEGMPKAFRRPSFSTK